MVESWNTLRSCLKILYKNNQYSKLPVVIDLFSGCGGLAFGFKAAGFKVVHGIELVREAADTASYNLYWRDGIQGQHLCGDITQTEASEFADKIGKNGCVVIGGPPCQAYSQIGRAKLRSLGEERKHTNDSRGFLFEEFLRIALDLNARAVVMENVPEAVNYDGLNVPQHVCEILEANGYQAHWTILNSADFGVPQVRERVIVIAIKDFEGKKMLFPRPTHKSGGTVTPGKMRVKRFLEEKNFIEPMEAKGQLPNWVTVKDALSDLPQLFPTSKSKYHLMQPNIHLPYGNTVQNDYQALMRNWFGIEETMVSGHGYRKTLRDFPIFERMQPGDDYRQASEIAEALLEEACASRTLDKNNETMRYEELRKEIVPPYDREKFLSKWKKLDPEKPSHTLVAHLSVDTYSHIHPWEARGISVREAARLQSFPDGFLFQCSMGDAFKQIGNAVPPLMAKAVAKALRKNLMNKQR